LIKDTVPPRLTPMFEQYHRIKRDHADKILLFRMGDFYEMFFDDAVAASGVLDIALTARGKGTDAEAPMCGVPQQSVDSYIARLIASGHRVAVCDQVEDAGQARGLVRREVVRVVSPGTVTDPAALDAHENIYIACLHPGTGGVGAAFIDLSTGDFQIAESRTGAPWEEISLHVATLRPREILHPERADPRDNLPREMVAGISFNALPDWTFARDASYRALTQQMKTRSLEGFGCEAMDLAVGAGGALVHYLKGSQRSALAHIHRVVPRVAADHMLLDAPTLRTLEVVRSQTTGDRRGSLLAVLDRTVTPMGSRLMRSWLLAPLLCVEPITARHDAVAELAVDNRRREDLRKSMSGIRDVERLLGRITLGTANARDLMALRASLERLPAMAETLAGLQTPLLRGHAGPLASSDTAAPPGALDVLADLHELLARSIADDPPATIHDGGMIREGYDAALDELRAISHDGRAWIARMEARERDRTGIASLKVRFNKVFGYYIEISRSNLRLVPPDYERKQTIVNAERFVTTELKEYEEKVLTAQDRIQEMEHGIFSCIRDEVAAVAPRITAVTDRIAKIDALAGLADVAVARGYARPVMSAESVTRIIAGRHPVVEALNTEERFVPNDVELSEGGARILIVTGPNMGGKSTYLRQVALITLMAQAGSFVPAAEATLGVADRIFSRIGSSDNLAGGQSTFMVEMQETANILNNATPRSLILLDEVGRGTSTFDGLSLAWAIVEHLHDAPSLRGRVLFATHYHELTELSLTRDAIRNLTVAVQESGHDVVFLRKIVEGAADRSYGIQVARLAGLPHAVIDRAQEVLANLEHEEIGRDGLPKLARHGEPGAPTRARAGQLPLFGPATDAAESEIARAIRGMDPDAMTPLEALAALDRLKRRLTEE